MLRLSDRVPDLLRLSERVSVLLRLSRRVLVWFRLSNRAVHELRLNHFGVGCLDFVTGRFRPEPNQSPLAKYLSKTKTLRLSLSQS